MRPDERDAAYLWDIMEAAQHIIDFVSELRFFDYERNRMVQAAVEREIEIIGEAARRLSNEFRVEHDSIPWRGMIAQRNVLAHEYGEIRQERIWAVAKDRIPELLEAIKPLLPPIPE